MNMDKLMDMSLNGFCDLLAGKSPAPGGGSAAALSGVLGSALAMMVVNLSVGKKSFDALDAGIRDGFMKDFEELRLLHDTLRHLVDEDTAAFTQYMAAVKMPAETPEDRQKRDDALNRASKYALEVPLKTAGKCLEVLRHQGLIAAYGNKNAVSDAGVGAQLAFAGIEGAALNVRINLPNIANDIIRNEAADKIARYLEEGESLKAGVMKTVNGRIA